MDRATARFDGHSTIFSPVLILHQHSRARDIMPDNQPTSVQKPATQVPIGVVVEVRQSDTSAQQPMTPASNFEQQAHEATPGLIAEFIDFLKHSKKWWLTPIIIVLLLIAVLIVLSSSVVAPFIYPFF